MSERLIPKCFDAAKIEGVSCLHVKWSLSKRCFWVKGM